jgi:polysaccharide export outer membrane protein
MMKTFRTSPWALLPLLLVVTGCSLFRGRPQTQSVAEQRAQLQSVERGPDLGSSPLRVGDRIVLTVQDEEALTDTFTVKTGVSIDLPVVGEIKLAGAARNEVEARITEALGKYIKDPLVTAQTLVRVAVLGEVTRAGYFALPTDALLADAINEAGGPSGEADMTKISLTRRGKVIESGPKLRNAIAAGRTLDEMDLQAGDEIIIPRRPDAERTARILSLVVAIPLTIMALGRM